MLLHCLGGVAHGLANVLGVQIGIGGEDFRVGHLIGDHPDDGCNRYPQAANAWNPPS